MAKKLVYKYSGLLVKVGDIVDIKGFNGKISRITPPNKILSTGIIEVNSGFEYGVGEYYPSEIGVEWRDI